MYDPNKKAIKALILRNLREATPSQRKEFRVETQQVGLDDIMNMSRETNKQEEKTMTRPSMVRRESSSHMGPLRRPIIGG